MASYFKFCGAVLKLAWQIAWEVVIERSVRAIIRDLIILIIAIFTLWEMRGYLEKIQALPEHDSFIAETLIWAVLLAAATITIFAATFVFCAIFVAPFQLYQKQIKNIYILPQNEYDKLNLITPKIDICFSPYAPYEISEIIQGRIKSTVRIGFKNSGTMHLSNCRIYIESVSPPPVHLGLFPAILDGGTFILRNDDPEKLIDVAYYFEHVNKYRFLHQVTMWNM